MDPASMAVVSQPAHTGFPFFGGDTESQGLSSLHPALLSPDPLTAGLPPSAITLWGLLIL